MSPADNRIIEFPGAQAHEEDLELQDASRDSETGISRRLAYATRVLLLLSLVYAPWAYGCTRAWAIHGLNGLLGLSVALWVARCCLRRAMPQVHPWLAGCAGLLMVQAWCMTIFSADRAASLMMAQRVTVLLGAACMAADLSRRSQWRKKLWWTIALAGASICLLGLAQRLGGANAIFWAKEKSGETFFAAFDYHANAGAFMNLVWPLVAGLLVAAFWKKTSAVRKALLVVLLGMCLTAAFVNTSRGAGALAAGLLVIVLGWVILGVLQGRKNKRRTASLLATIALVGVIIGGLAATVGFDETVRRWKLFGRELSERNGRLQTARVCLHMLPDAGWAGFGPGSFEKVFPRYKHLGNYAVQEQWVFAHQDYLQTVIEWGWAGAALWAVFAFGGVVQSIRARRRARGRWALRDRVFHFVILISLLGAGLHSLFDYPMQVASIQLYVVVLLGMVWGCREWKTPRRLREGAEERGPAEDATSGEAAAIDGASVEFEI